LAAHRLRSSKEGKGKGKGKGKGEGNMMTTRLSAALAVSIVLFDSGASKAQTTQNIDMTTLTPAYLSNSTGYVNGEIGPGYSQSATTNQLIITGSDLPVESNSFAASPFPVTGDFTATVQSLITNYAGTNFSSNTPGGYVEVGTLSFGGDVSTNFNYGLSGSQLTINGPSFSSQPITEQLSRSGDVVTGSVEVDGRWAQISNVSGPAVVGPDYLSVSVFGGPGEIFTGTFTNFNVTTFAPTAASGVSGGSASKPVALPAKTIGSVTGDVGAAGDFFSFYWQGGDFQAQVGVPFPDQLLPYQSVEFELCGGVGCQNVIETADADSGDNWQSSLSGDLAAGYYTTGIILQGAIDPQYFVDFTTPVVGGSIAESVPEPSTWAMLLMGFAGLGFVAFHRSRKGDIGSLRFSSPIG
jgi:PEP-CTERM motif